MGLEHLAAVLDRSRQSGSSLVVLLVVASYSDHQGEWVINQATLQKRARLGRRRVQQILAELIDAGELAVVPGDGRGHRSTYRLLLGSEEPRKDEAERAFPTTKGEAPYTVPPAKSEAECTFSEPKGEAPCTDSPEKGAPARTYSPGKGAAEHTVPAPPCPPSPPPPNPP